MPEASMNTALHHILFLTVCVTITVVVGRTLFRCGRPFVIECVDGDEQLADSVNRLLLAGYYLLNIGLVGIAVRFGGVGRDTLESLEFLGSRIGWILLIQGVMHCVNMIVLSELRRRRLDQPLEIVEFLD
jgi:hypothetical protein